MRTTLTCIINNRNIFGAVQALVPRQLLNMFHRTFISQLPFLLWRGKEQALPLFKCVLLPTLLVCLCPEAVQMIRLTAIQALRQWAQPRVQPIYTFQVVQDIMCRSTFNGFNYSKNALIHCDQQYTYYSCATPHTDHRYQVGDSRHHFISV